MKRKSRLASSMTQRPPWVLAPASALFVIALILYQSLGKAVGAALTYSGAAMMVRFRREPPDFLKELAGWYAPPESLRRPTAPLWYWQAVSLVGGLVVLAFGVLCFVLSAGSW